MPEPEVLDVLRAAVWVALIISAPVLVVALVVGLAIGLLQALTSVQEMTLTFVPKLASIAVAFWLSMSFAARTLVTFFEAEVIARIVTP